MCSSDVRSYWLKYVAEERRIRIVRMLGKERMSGARICNALPFANAFACADKHKYISENRTESELRTLHALALNCIDIW